jgi:hypothetical protein
VLSAQSKFAAPAHILKKFVVAISRATGGQYSQQLRNYVTVPQVRKLLHKNSDETPNTPSLVIDLELYFPSLLDQSSAELHQ